MKMIKNVLCVFLCVLIACTSFPVYAASNEFISFIVETIDEHGDIHENKEVGYTDGKNIFVSTRFLEKYTLYYYNSDKNIFIRRGQPENSIFGSVKLDYSSKKAIVYSISTVCKEYDLDGYYVFGDQYFLPLDKMCAFLKAMIKEDGNRIRILNSGYSLADAEYAFSLISGKAQYMTFGVPLYGR